jgi:DNA-directed RNA polymerase subunit H (RpoH/RPB5)
MDNEDKRELTEQELLEEIYKMDPLIRKAAEKLQRLSEDKEIVRQYHIREEQLKKMREKGEVE